MGNKREATDVLYGNTAKESEGLIEIIKILTAPWKKDEIKWRVGSMTKDKTKALPLAYIDARTVMERLDNAVGVVNWQDRYEFSGTRTICYLSLRLDGEWICKADGAGDSDIEGEKGGISDAFKRASVKWGMGRELYELKCRWMPCNEYKQLVGDPWKFVIKDAIEDAAKIQLPSQQKLIAATEFTNKYLAELEGLNANNIINLENTYAKKLESVHNNYPELSKKIKDTTALKHKEATTLLQEFQAA